MNARQHALMARRLIAACGGLDEASRECRLKRSRLAEFQDPHGRSFMPADVMNQLELYVGEPIYSARLAEDRPADLAVATLAEEACETAEEAVDLQRLARLAQAAGGLSPRQRDELRGGVAKLEEQLRRLAAAAERAGS